MAHFLTLGPTLKAGGWHPSWMAASGKSTRFTPKTAIAVYRRADLLE